MVVMSQGHIDWFQLCNCEKFYFVFGFEIQMWVRIFWIFERDRIPISNGHLLFIKQVKSEYR